MPSGPPSEAVWPFEYDVPAKRWGWAPGLRDLHGLRPEESPTTQVMLARMLLQDRNLMRKRLVEHLAAPGTFSYTYQLRDGRGRVRRIRYVGQSEAVAGEVNRLHGFVIDITDLLAETAADAVAGAVEHRASIEQAKGAIMLSFGINGEAAFDLLRGYSTRSNIKLASVAEHIVDGLSDPSYSRDDPVRGLLDILLALEQPAAGAAILRHQI